MAGRAHPSNGGGQAASAAPFAAAAVAAAAAGADTVTAQLSPTSFLQLLDQQEQPHRAGDLVPDLRLGCECAGAGQGEEGGSCRHAPLNPLWHCWGGGGSKRQLLPSLVLLTRRRLRRMHPRPDPTPALCAADKEDGGQEWLISFLGTLQGVEAVAAFLYGAGSRRAQQAEPILGSMCVGMYTLLEKLLHVRNPWGLAVSTTSKRLLHPEGQYRMGDVNLCGSDAFHAVLGKVAEQLAGFSERRLFEKPRLILEVHLADVGKVAALLLPFDRVRLLPPSGSRRRPRLPSLPAAAS